MSRVSRTGQEGFQSFVAVADTGSVTAAARTQHVAQPSLSRQLRQLERELGIALFDRREGRLTISAAGRLVLPVAREVLSRAASARDAAASLAAGRLERVTIAAPGTTLTDVIAPFVATIGPDDPLPAVRESLPRTIYAELGRGADLVVGTEPPPAAIRSMCRAIRPRGPTSTSGPVRLRSVRGAVIRQAQGNGGLDGAEDRRGLEVGHS